MKIGRKFFSKQGESFRSKYPFFYAGEFMKGISYLVLYVPVRLRTIKEHTILN